MGLLEVLVTGGDGCRGHAVWGAGLDGFLDSIWGVVGGARDRRRRGCSLGGGALMCWSACVSLFGVYAVVFFPRRRPRTGFQGILNTQALSSSQILVLQRRSSSASCQN